MSLIPNITQARFYMVKNVSATDKAAAVAVLATVTTPLKYDVLEYNGVYTFDATEDYFQELTFSEQEIAIISPLFWDIVTEINDPATHDEAHDKIRPFFQNDANFCLLVLDDLKVSLHYVIGNPTFPTPTELHDMYTNTLHPLMVEFVTGDVVSLHEYLDTLTGSGLATDTGLGTSTEWDGVLYHLHEMIEPYLEKFPR